MHVARQRAYDALDHPVDALTSPRERAANEERTMNTQSARWLARIALPVIATAFACGMARAAATDVAIGSPGSVAVDANGNVYFSSPNLIYKLAPGGGLSIFAGRIMDGNPDIAGGYGGDGGPATAAELNFPLWYFAKPQVFTVSPELTGQLAVDTGGNVYLADAYNNRVRRIDASGRITTVAGNGTAGNAGDGASAVAASLDMPQGVAVDAAGNLFIANADGRIRKVAPDGTITTIASMLACGSGLPDSVQRCQPSQLAVSPAGTIATTDNFFCRIRAIRADGTIDTIAGVDPVRAPPRAPGQSVSSYLARYLDFDPADYDGEPVEVYEYPCGTGDDQGDARAVALDNPYGVAFDVSGNLFIADTYNSCIRKVDASGSIATVAGRCGPFDYGDRSVGPGFAGDGGPAVEAQLSHPHGVAVGIDGTLYIADTGNSRVRKVDASGTITTIAGSGWWLPEAP
jgi:sugar lactone lactonase YvrE